MVTASEMVGEMLADRLFRAEIRGTVERVERALARATPALRPCARALRR